MTHVAGGVLIIDKEEGMTSAAVVSRVRVLLGEKRVGHTGTLDPFATGVLPVCFGRATAAAQYMLHWNKRYLCSISLGMSTDTMDSTGMTVEQTPETNWRRFASDDPHIQRELEAVTCSFIGKRIQEVPIYSAVKVDGKRLYRYAREGSEVDLPKREITVYDAICRGVSIDNETGFPAILVEFLVSAGTYIRVLAEEFGRALGCFAHAQRLRRLAAGPLTIERSITLNSLFELFNALGRDPKRLRRRIREEGIVSSLGSVFADWRTVIFDRASAIDLTYGRKVSLTAGRLVSPFREFKSQVVDDELFAFYYGEQLIAIGFIEGEYYRVKRVFLEPADMKSFEGMSS
ncbi:MAG TPA: tRNA pseudouridine(55) synthase TruB [Clostridiaceae bacterium]|nr:tRNA pseudouridine(55) synthase TruB [Clostridiaceae bacterium]